MRLLLLAVLSYVLISKTSRLYSAFCSDLLKPPSCCSMSKHSDVKRTSKKGIINLLSEVPQVAVE